MTHEPDLNSDERARLLLLAGFLGSGKTTLLKRILSWDADLSKSVVLVNEFGDVGIDGSLLKGAGSDVIELNSGCICCTLSADLKQSLEDIWKRFRPERVFIESSGVADPAAIITALQEPVLTRAMRIHKVLTVLDADFWEAREVFGPLFYSQLEMADLILLNKIDTQEKEKISGYLKEMHEVFPNTQVVPTIHCNIDSETLWTETGRGNRLKGGPNNLFNEILPKVTISHDDHHSHHGNDASNFITFSFQDNRVMDESCFKQFVDELPFELFRLKGPVRFQESTVLLNSVGGKKEWEPWSGDPETRLAFIGWDVDRAEILDKLEKCILDQ